MISFVDPATQTELTMKEEALVDNSRRVAFPIVDGIARFVESEDDYAENFGWQ